MIRTSILLVSLALAISQIHAEYVNFEVSHVHPIALTPSGSRLLEQASIAEGSSVLDLGCGTGTLAVQIAQAVPTVEVTMFGTLALYSAVRQ